MKNAIVCTTDGKPLTEQDKRALDQFVRYRRATCKKCFKIHGRDTKHPVACPSCKKIIGCYWHNRGQMYNHIKKCKETMKAPFISREQEFLEKISEYQDVGFGRMMQILSFAYHEYAPMEAFIQGYCFGMLPPEDREVYLKTKKSDPLDYSIIKPRKDKNV